MKDLDKMEMIVQADDYEKGNTGLEAFLARATLRVGRGGSWIATVPCTALLMYYFAERVPPLESLPKLVQLRNTMLTHHCWYIPYTTLSGDGDDVDDDAGQGLDLSEFFESTSGCFTTPQVGLLERNLWVVVVYTLTCR